MPELSENMNRLSSVFDVVWKICLLATLLWIGQSLREIADASYLDNPPSDSAESMDLETPGEADRIRPEKVPAASEIPNQVRV